MKKRENFKIIGKLIGIILFLAVIIIVLVSGMLEVSQKNIKRDEIPSKVITYLNQNMEQEEKICFQSSVDNLRAKKGFLSKEDFFTLFENDEIEPENHTSPILAKELRIVTSNKGNVRCITKNNEIVDYSYEKDLYDYSNLCAKDLELSEDVMKTGTIIKGLCYKNKILLLESVDRNGFWVEKVWIERNDDLMECRIYGDNYIFSKDKLDYTGYEDIADIKIKNGGITDVKPYTKKIHGKLIAISEINQNENRSKEGVSNNDAKYSIDLKDSKGNNDVNDFSDDNDVNSANDSKYRNPGENEIGYQIEVEGYPIFKANKDIQVYKLFGNNEEYNISDLIIGYDFTDFVLDDNDIVVAALAVKEENMDKIRVLIRNEGFEGLYHDEIVLRSETDISIVGQSKDLEKLKEIILENNKSVPKEKIDIKDQNVLCVPSGTDIPIKNTEWEDNDNKLLIKSDALTGRIEIANMNRALGHPSYRGNLEIRFGKQGITVVNELSLEEYLYAVVPSEMPAGYPEEALKAQTVCARTYAYSHMKRAGLAAMGAHVDDSTMYQVYNNCLENAKTTQAVRQTKGKVLMCGGNPAQTYFYSTSCGYGTDLSVWEGEDAQNKEKELTARKISSNSELNVSDEETIEINSMKNEESVKNFLNGDGDGYFEKNESFFRWNYDTKLDLNIFYANLESRYEKDPKKILTYRDGEYESAPIHNTGIVTDIKILERGPGGDAKCISIETESAVYKIYSELNIRYILMNENDTIQLKDGKTKKTSSQFPLPSAFIYIQLHKEDNLETSNHENVKIEETDLEESDLKDIILKDNDNTKELSTNETALADEITGYTIKGGGYGHGIGMSQNGAKNMAEEGYLYDRILRFFYQKAQLKTM